ncbi:YegS/Rv2252/BmrU family lipid kinase [Aminipila luticellarii]|uniref:YegS/Rv2252/BmrU family lipid kinase n=1 Tax=Aminipila luticellarii TaxID=2507160 RepID=A0A410PU14_9FIRM|nr:YegS/Rv2252/BmrU family lipid kinase [Aminipila luticellarii]QAT42404.1 YegS/Rv2252/BmrU family lipid kinase [Aminipila luticellarii]
MNEAGMKRVLLFYNPHSGNGMFKNNLDLIIDRFQIEGYIVEPVRAAHGETLDRIFQCMDQSQFSQVIAAGGDGTINICVNAMLRNNIELPLTVMPAGTANDFAYYFDLPHDINDMMDIALGGKFTYADVGKVNNKYFINVAAMGMLVDVSQKTDPNLKNTLGILSYYLKGLTEVTNLRPIPVKLTSNEFSGEENMYFMLVMNGRSAGGFKKISPNSEINDGMLDVMLFKEMPILEFGPLLVSILQGNHQENKNVIYFKTDDLMIESTQDVSTDVDGEKGEKFPLHFTVLPSKLKISTLHQDMKGPFW